MLLVMVLATDTVTWPLSHKRYMAIFIQHFIMTMSIQPCMYDTVIMYKHFITPVFPLLLLIFSSNGQLILRQRATEISPGHYPMDLACCFILAMKNGTQRRGCLREHFIIQVLGKMQYV